MVELVMASHAGITTDEFAAVVSDWIRTARHPKFKKPYTALVYQPMLELLAYLRTNSFKTFIVSGGGVEFMRVFAQRVYGIPPEQVVGSMIETEFEMKDGKPVLMRLPKIDFIDDGPGKPAGINKFIGRRPVFAFGNSDGDKQMLEWTTAGKDQMPPVDGFWSLTLYDAQHFFVPNPITRFSIGTKNKELKTGADGSLTIYVQPDSPGDPAARQLAAGAQG